MPTSTDDPVVLAETLRPALLRVSRRLRQEAQKAGVSALDALLLTQIARSPGVGVCDLADSEQLSRPTMSGHIKRLEAAGWITRADSATDGRRSGLAITASGEAQLDAIRQHRNDWLAARLAKLPVDARRQLDAAAGPLLQLLSLEA
ncbi:MAG: MarR family transcriptional regulator [Phenylobacterium sp.]|uniref:MarR family transcriptional regulator n=1 Tax=Phenylobacterium ferrooxidans TaxID=2982689 RepID=A0ABW6CMA3_9CAUL|nr:MarR family transcriptional regulator [Phenylobacterium sp.]MDO8324922.1 MarR family transcriptional regulator [Phenylobacterium sp.]MDO8910985.1 MarR family transcriptional regulator [Phenylobacterium sp.]MDP2009931.1 MarR family transcriptional regulator [Phenylobacterium sp.]MDP3099985.1 MarR family transcriptional regulator [Phenylobacterium sp.]MDP3632212.1 MarR family transcriptional regulator [Phenylobacterium sp.]